MVVSSPLFCIKLGQQKQFLLLLLAYQINCEIIRYKLSFLRHPVQCTLYIHIYSSDMIYCSSGIFLLAQTWSLNVKLILATTARMTIIGIFPFCFHVLCNIHACNIHVFCNSTCVQQLSLYCKCLSVADRQQCCTGWSMGEFLTRVKRESRRKESLPVKGLLDIYFRFASCILLICRSHQYL